MSGAIFVDTNVLLYAVDLAHPQKHQLARHWRDTLWKTGQGRLSFQVLQEFYANVSRKWPKSTESARLEIEDLFTWQPVSINADILRSSWKIQHRFGISFWDSLIVAAAKAAQCSYLLSEDFQAGLDLDGLRVVNPFQTRPDQI